MSTFLKRTGGVVVIIISGLVLLAMVLGVTGLWALRGGMNNLTAAVFSPIDSALTTVGNALEKVDTRVSSARTRVSNAQTFVEQLGENLPGNGVVLSAISETVGVQMGTEIDAANESVSNALDLTNGANNAIEALNKLPNFNVPALTNASQALEERMTTLRDRVQQLRTDMEAMVEGRLQITSSRVNSLLEDLDGSLEAIQSKVNEQIGSVQQSQARITALKSDIEGWITIGTVVSTIFLVWIALSQVAMLMYGWSLLKGKPKDLVVPAAPTTPAVGVDINPTA
jgi:peptidoglycan hydrolase CwlO-like protein